MHRTPIYFAGCDLSASGHLRLAAYLREMQKIACLDLYNFDLSPQMLYEHGIAFILSKTSLIVEKTQLDSWEMELLTYPRQSRGASFMRDFVFTQNGETIARATTRWGILNLKTRTLCRPGELPKPVVGETQRWVGFEPPRLSPILPENAKFLAEETVPRCMTDANGHLNNAAYLDLCLNCTEDLAYREMHIEYRREMTEGDGLKLYRAENPDGSFLLYGVRASDGELSFLVSLRA